MKFVVHNTGDWIRKDDWTSSTRTDGWVKEFNSLDEVDSIVDRSNFEWMLDMGEFVMSAGSYVWQIRH